MWSQDKKVRWDWEYLQSLTDDTACYQLTEKQVNFLLAVHPAYQWSTRWQNVGASTPDDWDAFGSGVLDALLRPSEDCGDCDEGSLGECFRLDTSSETFDFYPNNPFDESDRRFTAINARWRRFATLIEEENLPSWFQAILDFLENQGGYFPNDCFISYTDEGILRESSFDNFFEYLASFSFLPFPYVNWQLRGTGQFEVEFCQVPFGGAVLLSWDITIDLEQLIEILSGNAGDEGDNWRLIEINRDIFGIPPELIPTLVQEIEFTVDEAHEVTALFAPRLDDQIPFIFPFGGIREIEICGLILIGTETGEEITPYNYGLEQHKKTGAIGTMSIDDICKGFMCALEEAARRILLAEDTKNILSDITIDKDTGETKLITGQANKENIQAVPQALHYGGVYYQAQQFAELFSQMNEYIDNTYGVTTIQSLTRLFAGIEADDFDLVTAWDSEVLSYVNADPEIVIDVFELAQLLNCKNAGAAIIQYAINEHSASETEVNYITNFGQLLPKSTLQEWYNFGGAAPRDGYQTTACYRIPDQVVVVTIDSLQNNQHTFFTDTTVQENRIKQLQFSGAIIDDDGRIYDGVYMVNDLEVVGSHDVRFNWDSFGNVDIINKPPYNQFHNYSILVDTPLDNDGFVAYVTLWVNQSQPAIGTWNNPQGEIIVKLVDVGSTA